MGTVRANRLLSNPRLLVPVVWWGTETLGTHHTCFSIRQDDRWSRRFHEG